VALAAEHPSPESLRRLEHEYSLAAEVDPEWTAKPLALTRHEGQTILVLKDPGGEPLDRILELGQGQLLDLTRVLRIAIGLTTALGQVHRHGLIHKDIKPENVLVDDSDRVWLTGFGIASRLPRERQAPAPPETIAGTLAFMAPEQTGCMNRSVDARSDLYSLGVTLYRMLTGTLPFAAADPLEWVHCHIARQPTPPSGRAAVPEPLSSLTLKLLAKNAEERYQTAEGLEADLRRCLAEWESHNRIDPFPLGTDDSSGRLLIPEKLYGREPEIDVLLAAFDRVVANGTAELVLVSGYSGVGKSSLVSELHKALVPPRGLFAAGKFDQYKRDIPYTTLAQAFQTLVRQILVKSEAEVDQWRCALAEAVGPNGQLIVNLVPELEFIIGNQLPLPALPPQDALNRFHAVLLRFLNVFARKEHPLVLFLDDLQWVDSATLDLLEYMFIHSGIRYLMVIGAYRDNEIGPAHPLVRALDTIRAGDARVQEIVLPPLNPENIERLVAEAIHCQRERAQPLAQLLVEKTGGNPFFTIRFLTVLAEEGLLIFDTVARIWRWDVVRIRAKNYSDNVVHLMADKLKSSSTATRDALKQLACLGNTAEIRLLALIRGETEEALHATLWGAVYTGIVFRLDSAYKFLHDSIQEAAYSLIPEVLRAEFHLRIGRVLVANMTHDELGERVFDVANQFIRSATLLTDPTENSRVATIHLRAGRRAKAAAAYGPACTYLRAATALLGEYNWAKQYDSTFETWLERAECAVLARNDRESEVILPELLERARSTVDQAAVYRLQMLLHILNSDNVEAVARARLCLSLFAIEFPENPTENQVKAEYDALRRSIGPRQIEELVELPLMRNHQLEVAMGVLSTALEPFFFTNLNLYRVVLCRMVQLMIQYGANGPSAYACAKLGVVVGNIFHDYREGYRFVRLACDLFERRGFIEYRGKIYLSVAGVAHWTEPIGRAIELNRVASRTAIEAGDLAYAAHANHRYLQTLLLRNDSLDAVWRESERGLDAAREAKVRTVEDLILNEQKFIATMQGRTPAFSTLGDSEAGEAAYEANLTAGRMTAMVCRYWTLKLKARLLLGDLPGALEAWNKARPLIWSTQSLIGRLDYFFYSALTLTGLFDAGSNKEQGQRRDLLAEYQEQLREWAENNPPTFADKHTLVLAEIARLERRDSDAMRLYEHAINLARENGFIQNEALAHEVAARFYAAHGVETVAHAYLRSARNCYDRWGALGKVRQIDAHHPRLHEERTPAAPTATISTPVAQLDVEAVFKASQALSSEIVLPNLIERLMRIAVEHAGAERGLLILLEGHEPHIEAEATTGHGRATVTVRRTAITPFDFPQSALHYVIRTQERVVIDDASIRNLYSEDEYVQKKRPRSVLCVPIVKQTKLVGALYLENNLTPRAFTSDRVAVLELLASQAAISLENAGLYADLQRSEAFLAEGQSLSHTGSFGWSVASGEIYWSVETYNIFEHDRAAKPTLEMVLRRTHPDDRDLVQQTVDRASETRADFDLEHRLLMPDGSVKHLHVSARALTTSSGDLEFVGAVTDVTAAKQAEEKSRQDAHELRCITDSIPQAIVVYNPDGRAIYVNRVALEYHGLSIEEVRSESLRDRVIHPDIERLREVRRNALLNGAPFEYELRILRKDGKYRWFLIRYNPFRDEQGRLVRWYATGTDIEDRKVAEQHLQNENVALREEIDRFSMFEEIVGSCEPMRQVLKQVAKVAPSDSTVLILGETGTGKELIARAFHRRSNRATRAFVRVNCAAIPQSLIASELFGHEKGAFTGALQRRVGRFESADGGTLFLDEIGDLPMETQIALLRVLQEREFERVGSNHPISVDVRLIAATNRELPAAVAAGTFRQDLFYRLNVVPIAVPSLRERAEDIPLLVEYFVGRYAKAAGKKIRHIGKQTLEQLTAYDWPGNIRELQNVVERAVILSETDTFLVDESWLKRESAESRQPREGLSTRSDREVEMIEAALAECHGRISGTSGAAAKLGIPRQTLESKIRRLGINKYGKHQSS
jgi:PAS domain S-box-containing protein